MFTFSKPFRFSDLPEELQIRILELVMMDYTSPASKVGAQFASYGGSSNRVLLGLDLPCEGVFRVSQELRVLSMQALYRLPKSPPSVFESFCQWSEWFVATHVLPLTYLHRR